VHNEDFVDGVMCGCHTESGERFQEAGSNGKYKVCREMNRMKLCCRFRFPNIRDLIKQQPWLTLETLTDKPQRNIPREK
jgi:hypothetical protein